MGYKAVILQLAENNKDEKELREIFAPELSEFEKNKIAVKLCKVNEYDKELLVKVLEDADIALCAGNPPFDAETLKKLPKLKVIVRYGIGVNSIDLNAATDQGKIVFYMKGYCLEELAMHASSLILALLRNTAWYDREMRAGNWMKGSGVILPRRLSTMTVGLFGLGGSGLNVARIMGKGFGARVIAYDPYVREETAKENGVELLEFDELLAQSDVISVHAPLTEQTKHIFNKETFGKMKRDAILVNISRGPIVNVSDLTEALREGQLAGAGLDVFEVEPLEEDNPLLKMDQVILTPHSAYYGKEAFEEQKRLASWLPAELVLHKRIRRSYVANSEVLKQFEGYEIL